MVDELKHALLRYTRAHSQVDGVTATSVRGFYLFQRTTPSEVEHTVVNPLVCLVLQGRKQVSLSSGVSSYAAGETLIVTGNVPTASRISQASAASPYLALALDLDPNVITDLVLSEHVASSSQAAHDTSGDLCDALRRLVMLLDRPESLAVLKNGLIREIHHWLLLGRQGHAVRNLGLPDSHVRRIARAVAILRADYAQPVHIERLAAAAGMSRAAFHQHFRAITSLSPLQFQKQLRLIEARRLILSKGKLLSQVAFEVGYESTSQFSREYTRMFGRSPVKDKQTVSER
ncbi:AraC family transcriptional regulator [Noviherbaspirillum sp. CPCC 100848]|uniref:AraC family transcriptional regulator n=2 Tax=Noviherbaspirillum album TaxID=3080276 RepID=A0ABU6J928_9BURK|nr:AraC family transcriptional regulator [Noviherbaspirillum sp. CPCC 100848]